MKIAYLGAGTWGICLASLLLLNGHEVIVWDRNLELLKKLKEKRRHPRLRGFKIPKKLKFALTIFEAIEDADIIVESVTSSGVRFVLEQIKACGKEIVPFVITSKGIEQKTGLLLPEIAKEVLGEKNKKFIGCIAGPSHAEEVVRKLPTSLVCSSYDRALMHKLGFIFNNDYFRVYPNEDIIGVAFGGAMKNIIAIACGLSDGLGYGDNTKAALITRGLHEIRKLAAVAKKCRQETLNGLSGLGDLCVTCLSVFSRNYRFGNLLAKGLGLEEAKERIGMVVEGAYTCVSAMELAKKHGVSIPISEAIFEILYHDLKPKEAVLQLLKRTIKEEHL